MLSTFDKIVLEELENEELADIVEDSTTEESIDFIQSTESNAENNNNLFRVEEE